MPETKEYEEDKDFIPNPTDAMGTFDTSGTAGTAHARIEEVTPIFDVAKAQDLAVAAKALDPEDDTSASLVVLPEGIRVVQGDPEAATERVRAAAKASAEAADSSGRETLAQKEAQETGTKKEAIVKEGTANPETGTRTGNIVNPDPDTKRETIVTTQETGTKRATVKR